MIDRQKTQEYEKRNKAVWTSNHKKCFYGGLLFLLLLFITSCKRNQFLIDSNEVENVNFWFIGDVDRDVSITDCLHIVFGNDSHKTIIRDRKIINRFLTLVNQLKPANPDSYIDLRVSSLIRLKPINGERRPDIKSAFVPVVTECF